MRSLQNNFSLKALLWVLVVFVQVREHKGCLEKERIGLLQLKSFLIMTIPYTYSDHLLTSWVEDASKSECCGWERVACNSTTGHVIELSLDNLGLSLGNPYYYYTPQTFAKVWSLNISLLEPFKELKSLDLSLNAINGWIVDEGVEKFSSLRNLESLNLGYNFFENHIILQSLGAITSLKILNLTSNGFLGYFPAQALVGLRNLNTLDISNNGFNGTLPNQGFERLVVLKKLKTLILDENNFDDSILPSLSRLTSLTTLSLASNWGVGVGGNEEDLANFIKLEILDMSENLFTGSVSPSIWKLFSLKALSLSSNELNGTLPTREFCILKKLEELDLSNNSFEGILPPCINNMTSLRFLDVSQNYFEGDISSYVATSQTSLEYIDFSYNYFEGLFSLSLLANKSKLEVIRFSNQNNKLEIETENPSGWAPLFQLKVLQMTNCSLNKLASNIPTFLLNQYELEAIDLSYNKLQGSFPNWLVENNTRLKGLDLQNNFFVGHLHFQPHQHTYISRIDVSNNHMKGKIQENIGKICPNLNYLNLSHNNFEGNLPFSIGDMTFLEDLDVSFNELSGEIPRELASNASKRMMNLNLGYNNFHGKILLEKLKFAHSLQMSGNQFTSVQPILNSTYSSLRNLDISHNIISGTISKGFRNNTLLETLILANNIFYGQIPCELSVTDTLDLSNNYLTGSLPVCLNLPELEHLYLHGNNFTGSILKVLFNYSSLLTLDVRDNSFSGSISIEIKQLQNLRVLLLSGNRFTGIIPNQLCLLRMISIMDLSKNAFSGTIPQCLHNIYFGKIGAPNVYLLGEGSYLAKPYGPFYTYKGFLKKDIKSHGPILNKEAEVVIEFVTKYMSRSYKGSVLRLMSGLDLSCNNLTGGIPSELGQISSIIALNLSHNQLDGPIPETFSKLTLLESLDLSHNSLSGEIPSVLIDLNFLAVFNVANNNFFGKVPDLKAQFATFEKSSYEGNPFLCGPPLDRSCTKTNESDPIPTSTSNASGRIWYEVDPVVFHASFLVSYIVFFFSVASILYIINPYWLQIRCYNLIEDLMYSCYYFVKFCCK